MKLAIIGYGRMGREIESIAIERGHHIILKINDTNSHDLNVENLQKANVAIEFTHPESALNNISLCFESKTPVVSGTTGWNNDFYKANALCQELGGTFFYASNFSIGVNIFFKLNEYLAQIMNKFDDYHPTMEEIHHTKKLDAPSGTAISLAEGALKHIDRIHRWKMDSHEKDTLSIHAVRKDPFPGTHKMMYNSEIDNITIQHEAKSRKGFALGAVLAAEFILGKTGIYSMNDLLDF